MSTTAQSTDATETLGQRYRPLSPRDFTKLCSGGKDPGKVAVRKSLDLESLEVKGSTVTFVSSSGAVDRDKDIIRPKGLSVVDWEKNPVVLFSHDARQQIGVGETRLTTTGKWLTEAEFFPKEFSPLADGLRQMIEWRKARARTNKTQDKGGAFSIGFMRLKSAWNDARGGIDFDETEKLEDSFVALPANREALAREAFADGVPLDGLFDWAENVRKEMGVVGVNAEVGQKLIELIDAPKGFTLVELTPEHLKHLKYDGPSIEPKEEPAVGAPEVDPVAFAFRAAQMNLGADGTKELMAAAGMGEFADGIVDAPEAPAPPPAAPAEKKDPTLADWLTHVRAASNGLPEKDQIKDIAKNTLSEEELREVFIDRVAAKTGHIPEPQRSQP